MRLFVALEIPAAIRDTFAVLLQELRSASSETGEQRPRWVRPENLHITLKFVGEAAPERLDGLRSALKVLRSPEPVDITFRGLGYFPNDKRPRVFWAGLEASANLRALAADVDHALTALGIPPETRAFEPHLTLARLASPSLSEKLRETIQHHGCREFGSFTTRDFHLFQSTTKPSGAEYTRLATFPFVTETTL